MRADPRALERSELGEASGASRERQVALRAESRLRSSGYPALTDLRCHFHEGSLFVSGNVPSYHLRQVVYALLKEIEGVEVFVDQVEVHKNPLTLQARGKAR